MFVSWRWSLNTLNFPLFPCYFLSLFLILDSLVICPVAWIPPNYLSVLSYLSYFLWPFPIPICSPSFFYIRSFPRLVQLSPSLVPFFDLLYLLYLLLLCKLTSLFLQLMNPLDILFCLPLRSAIYFCPTPRTSPKYNAPPVPSSTYPHLSTYQHTLQDDPYPLIP